ncbi:META domain-containing protein [Aquimarina sp. SS2-1]|uniref:META domain-containing protein n=1 Tax=Aquimarina besae TaxID=3342247 RepID=UPI00366B7B24
MKYVSFLLFSVTLLSNCNSANIANNKSETSQKEPELTGTYFVSTLYGEDVSKYKLTLTFDPSKKTLSGFSGCNSYTSEYSVDGKLLTTGFPIATKMFCEETSNLEKQFFKMLSEEKNKNLEGNTLSLTNGKKENILFAKKEK